MRIVKSLALAAGLAIMTANVTAQNKSMDPQAWAQRQTAQIKTSVTGITPDQESKIMSIEQGFAKSMQDARESSNGDRDAFRAKLEPAKQDRDTKIKAILTGDQVAQYEKMVASHPMGGHRSSN